MNGKLFIAKQLLVVETKIMYIFPRRSRVHKEWGQQRIRLTEHKALKVKSTNKIEKHEKESQKIQEELLALYQKKLEGSVVGPYFCKKLLNSLKASESVFWRVY